MGQINIPVGVRQFVKKLKTQYAPCRVLLFGSHARGDAGKWSDYDFLIISPHFEGIHVLDRSTPVRMLYRAPFPLDVICLTPEEFDERKRGLGIIAVAAKEAVELTA